MEKQEIFLQNFLIMSITLLLVQLSNHKSPSLKSTIFIFYTINQPMIGRKTMIGRKKIVPWDINFWKGKHNNSPQITRDIGDTLSNLSELPFVSLKNNFNNRAQQENFDNRTQQEIIKYLQGENNKTPEKKPWFLWLVSSKFQSTIARSFLNEEFIKNANKGKEGK